MIYRENVKIYQENVMIYRENIMIYRENVWFIKKMSWFTEKMYDLLKKYHDSPRKDMICGVHHRIIRPGCWATLTTLGIVSLGPGHSNQTCLQRYSNPANQAFCCVYVHASHQLSCRHVGFEWPGPSETILGIVRIAQHSGRIIRGWTPQ